MSEELNPQQREAVRYVAGPLLVLAGAGSGKTRVIAAKIAYLLATGTAPAGIAAITFTNKAAREMRARAQALARIESSATRALTVSTFHALGLKFLRMEAQALGIAARFSVFDPQDAAPVLAELLGTTERSRVRAAQWRISQWKNALVPPEAALAGAEDSDAAVAARAYARYDAALRSYQAVDFDDLITRPVAAIGADPAIAARWAHRFAHVLVDEYQDTNPAQYRFLAALVGAAQAFTAVGDDDQAIYGFRGASADNLKRLTEDFPALRVIKLEQNYRSATRILRSANALIANNAKLFDKRLWSALGPGDTISVAPAADDAAEAEDVVSRIAGRKFETRARYADFAILYRSNHQARAFEKALRAASMPYVVSGGQSWFERTEIRDVLAYLRVIANEGDDPAFIRALTTPKRGAGSQTLAQLSRLAQERGTSLAAAASDADFTPVAAARDAVNGFCRLIDGLRFRAAREPAGRLVDELLDSIGYAAYLHDTFDRRDAETRAESVRDFAAWITRKCESEGKNLFELTQAIVLAALHDDDDVAGDAIHLSTLHAAKGLEFRHVFLVGLEEGILPHREAIAADQVDEERRLMYVGLTRAQASLHLSWCRKRQRGAEVRECSPSRFIAELAQDDLRYAGSAVTASDAEAAKRLGSERLKNLKAMLGR